MASLEPTTSAKIESRKQEHLDLCKSENVESLTSAGWENIQLPHCAMPENDFSRMTTTAAFLGHQFSAPLLISSMTGGSREGEQVNFTLAKFAQDRRIPMGVGSQRVAIEHRSSEFTRLRQTAPKAVLFANIGIVQLNYGVSIDDLKWIIDSLQAQALIFHANVLQEAIQEEGDRSFANLFEKIETVKTELDVPVILKETGCGLDIATCRRALNAGVDALDVAGMGGTHWGYIEGLRSPNRRALGDMFRNWGIKTPDAIRNIRHDLGNKFPLVASGGIRNGLDMAKALYLGADFTGMALPFLKAASSGEKALHEFLDLQLEALKIATFCMGQVNAQELKHHGDK